MPNPRMGLLLSQISGAKGLTEVTDAELIRRFLENRDDEAFATIVSRHGRTVLGVCRRVLGNLADADDAFQVTFLVLARKAHRISFHDDISSWLYAVALRASRELQRQRTCRDQRERMLAIRTVAVQDAEPANDEQMIVLDEVGRLSAPLQSSVILFELEGLSRGEAARRLGIPEGTLSSRLASARRILSRRLSARGVTLSVLLPISATVSSSLTADTVQSVLNHNLPSQPVLAITEVLMKSKRQTQIGSLSLIAGLFFATAIGFCWGEDPKAKTIVPASAKVVEEDRTPSAIIALTQKDARYFSPEGKELRLITYVDAKRVDEELLTGSMTLGGKDGFRILRYLPHSGRVGPGGEIPLSSQGLKILKPGKSLSISRIDSTERNRRIAGWSPDGSELYASIHEDSVVWGITKFETFRVDRNSGKSELMPFGRHHSLFDVSADGTHFLSQRFKSRIFGVPGFDVSQFDFCILNPQGETEYEWQPRNPRFEAAQPRISPDGKQIADVVFFKNQQPHRSALSIVRFVSANEIERKFVYFPGDESAQAMCHSVAWSPDGTKIASVWTMPDTVKTNTTWHLMICDADGSQLKPVAKTELEPNDTIRSIDWR